MPTIATTRMSSKGQVVIPESIREGLGLNEGERFVVVGQGDVVILKTVRAPDRGEVTALIAKARSQARRAGLTQKHVKQAIRRVRQRS